VSASGQIGVSSYVEPMHADPLDLAQRTTRRRHGAAHHRAWRATSAAALLALVAAACAPVAEDPAARAPSVVREPTGTPGNNAPAGTYITSGERLGVGGCPLFPRNNVFHADASTLQVTPRSDATIAAAGPSMQLKSSFRSAIWQGSRGGVPVNIVDSRTTPMVNVIGGAYSYVSDLDAHPIPAAPRIEGYPGMAWDRHMLLVDSATCRSHEFFYVTPPFAPFTSQWVAQTVVKIDLTSNATRRGSAIASGGSMLARMLRYDEVASGRIDHVLGVSLPSISNLAPVWPAISGDGRSTNPDAPRMGTWLRLRGDADLSGLGPDARLIAEALQQHGAVLGDTGPPDTFVLVGENDSRWNDADLRTLGTLTMSDFEVVDPTPMKVADNSYEIR